MLLFSMYVFICFVILLAVIIIKEVWGDELE